MKCRYCDYESETLVPRYIAKIDDNIDTWVIRAHELGHEKEKKNY